MRQRMFTLLAGMALGMVLLSGGYAASTALTATVSNQPIYVDGQRVYLTAYHIGGNNFVKLRDIGQAVGFNVYWDGTVQIESDKPYTGVIPSSQTPVPTQLIPTVPTEASAQAAIKALRDTYPHGTAYPTPYRPNNLQALYQLRPLCRLGHAVQRCGLWRFTLAVSDRPGLERYPGGGPGSVRQFLWRPCCGRGGQDGRIHPRHRERRQQ